MRHRSAMVAIVAIWVLLVTALPASATGATLHLVSVNSAGHQGNADSGLVGVSISGDGRYVAFQSTATNLAAHSNGCPYCSNIFVRDRVTRRTALVSIGAGGQASNGNSYNQQISADGRYVVFDSGASNLVPHDTNGVDDVFVRDLTRGITRRVSVTAAGSQANNYSDYPSISADGMIIAFQSYATNLVLGVTSGIQQVYVRDLLHGTTRLVSAAVGGGSGSGDSGGALVSGNGRYIAFASFAPNLVPRDTNKTEDSFVRDLVTDSMRLVSRNAKGQQLPQGAFPAGLSADGRYVAFLAYDPGIAPGPLPPPGNQSAYVRDLRTGTNVLVSLDPAGRPLEEYQLALSGDGQSVGLGAVPVGSSDQMIYYRYLPARRTQLISSGLQGQQANRFSANPAISEDGQALAFMSAASNLVPGDINGAYDVFTWDRAS